MRIKTTQAWWVRIPIETARQHRSDFGQIRTFDAAIVRIETDDGLVGWGEGKNAAGSAGSYGALVHMLNHEFGPMIAGRSAGDIGPIWEMLYNGVRSDSAVRHGHAMPQIARPSTSRSGTFLANISASLCGSCSAAARQTGCRLTPRAAGRRPRRSANN